LKKLKAGHHGLNMGLCPCQAMHSNDDTVGIAEDSFWFLEHGIKKHCARYTSMAHYGVTAISREEWLVIFNEWGRLRVDLDRALLTTDLVVLRSVAKHARREFVMDFARNKGKLSKLIGQVAAWIRAELIYHEHISILGI
jgi:hypothetical protein